MFTVLPDARLSHIDGYDVTPTGLLPFYPTCAWMRYLPFGLSRWIERRYITLRLDWVLGYHALAWFHTYGRGIVCWKTSVVDNATTLTYVPLDTLPAGIIRDIVTTYDPSVDLLVYAFGSTTDRCSSVSIVWRSVPISHMRLDTGVVVTIWEPAIPDIAGDLHTVVLPRRFAQRYLQRVFS